MNENNNSHLEIVYEQYFEQARHAENQIHKFTAFYMTVVAGVLVLLSSINQINFLIYAKILLLVLSIVGFLFNYALRVPFYKFSLKAELLAINEFNLKKPYWRFFESQSDKKFYINKKIDTFAIFSILYFMGIGLSLNMIFANHWYNLLLILFVVKYYFDRQSLLKIRKKLKKEIKN